MFERWRYARSCAASERPDPRDELAEVNRPGQIVVGAETEPFDPVLDGVGGGQHQHPALRTLGDERAADLIAVHFGEVSVQHDHVIRSDGRAGERVAAVMGDVDRDPLAAQPGRNGVGQDLVIFDK